MEFLALGLVGLLLLTMFSRKESDGYCYVILREEDAKALLSEYSNETKTSNLKLEELKDEPLVILIPEGYGEKDVVEYEQYQKISNKIHTMPVDRISLKRHDVLVYKKDNQYFLTTAI